MKKTITLLLLMAIGIATNAQQSVVSTMPGLLIHIPFTNNSTDGNGNYFQSAAEIGIIPTIAGNWFNAFTPAGITKRVDRLLNSNAISFTGSGHITANVTIPSEAFTISYWQNLKDGDGSGKVMLASASTPGGTDWQFSVVYNYNSTKSTVVIYVYKLASSFNITRDIPLTASESGWKYISYTWSASDAALKMYLNGEYVTSVASNVVLPINSGKNLYLGGYPGATTDKGKGRMDEISVFSRALSANEIKTLYNRCAPITEIARTDVRSGCISTPAQFAVTVSSSALSGYWGEVVIGAGYTIPSSLPGANTTSISVPMPTVTGQVRAMRYIAVNECSPQEEFSFNTLQTTAVAVPNPSLAAYNLNGTTFSGCGQSGLKLNVLGENTVNSVYSLLIYNAEQENYVNTQLTPFSNQFTLGALNVNQGTYVAIATNACGAGTTTGLTLKEPELSFTGSFLEFTPSILARVEATNANTSKFYTKTIFGVTLGSTVILTPGTLTNSNNSFTWYKNGVALQNQNSEIPVNCPGAPNCPPVICPGGPGCPPPGGGPKPGGRVEATLASTVSGLGTSNITITGISADDLTNYTLTTSNSCGNVDYEFYFTLNSGVNTSIADFENSKVSVYPNPSEGNFTIESTIPFSSSDVRVTDVFGAAQAFTITNNTLSINKSGVFMFTLKGKTTKLIVL